MEQGNARASVPTSVVPNVELPRVKNMPSSPDVPSEDLQPAKSLAQALPNVPNDLLGAGLVEVGHVAATDIAPDEALMIAEALVDRPRPPMPTGLSGSREVVCGTPVEDENESLPQRSRNENAVSAVSTEAGEVPSDLVNLLYNALPDDAS